MKKLYRPGLFEIPGRGKYRVVIFFFICAVFAIHLYLAGCARPPAPGPAVPTYVYPEEAVPPVVKPPLKLAPEEEFAKAEELFANGRLEEARDAFQDFLIRYPDHRLMPKVLLRLGEIYLKSGDPYIASVVLKRALAKAREKKGDETAILRLLLQSYTQMNLKREAISILYEMVIRAPDFETQAELRFELARLYLSDNKILQALDNLQRAYVLTKKREKKEQFRKEVENIIDETEDVKELEKLVDTFSASFISHYARIKLAYIYMQKREYDRAKNVLDPVVLSPIIRDYKREAEEIIGQIADLYKVDPFAIGILAPLTGKYGYYGKHIVQGVELASMSVSAGGTTMRELVKLVIMDTRFEPETARREVDELVRDHRVVCIIGPLGGSTSLSAASEAQRLKVPIITLTAADDIPSLGDYVFRNFITAEQQVKTLVRYIMDRRGLTRFAVLYPDDPYGRKYMNLFWDEIEKRDGRIMGVEAYDPQSTDVSEQIKKLVGLYYVDVRMEEEQALKGKNGPADNLDFDPIIDFQAILIPDSYDKIALIAPQLAFHDVLGVRLLGTNLWNSQELVKQAGKYLRTAIFVDGFFPRSLRPEVKMFVKKYRNAYGETPDVFAVHAFDSAKILFELIKNGQITSRKELRNALSSLSDFKAVTGKISFDGDGEARKRLFLLTIRKGRIMELGRF